MAVRKVSTRVVVLTKEPIAGRVKTRLFPVLSPHHAARLHAEMALETIRRAQASGLPVDVALDGDLDGDFAHQLRALGCRIEAQVSGDLGTRLRHALRGPGRRIALGTDCIVFEPDWLRQAEACPTPVSIGPADDGGYWSIGVDLALPHLGDCVFSNQPWSAPELFASTQARLEEQGFALTVLPTSWDVDRPGDLERLRRTPGLPASVRALVPSAVPGR